MTEILSTLDLKVINSSTYSYEVFGGTLESINKLRVTLQCTSCLIEVFLSAVGGPSVQILSLQGMFISSTTVTATYGASLTAGISDSVKTAYASGTEDSASDQTLNISVSGGTILHASVEKIGEPVNPDIPEPELPNTQILALSLLSKLPADIYKDLRFYAELLHHLDIVGVGEATFTRAAASTAAWRDGASHAVGINEPRFEYDGEDALGVLINTAAESLAFSTSNLLSDSNTLFWVAEDIIYYTPATSNPFSASGTYVGASGVHLKHILKFGRVLTSREITIVIQAITQQELEPVA